MSIGMFSVCVCMCEREREREIDSELNWANCDWYYRSKLILKYLNKKTKYYKRTWLSHELQIRYEINLRKNRLTKIIDLKYEVFAHRPSEWKIILMYRICAHTNVHAYMNTHTFLLSHVYTHWHTQNQHPNACCLHMQIIIKLLTVLKCHKNIFYAIN